MKVGKEAMGEKGGEEKRKKYFQKKLICLFSPNMNKFRENEFDFPA